MLKALPTTGNLSPGLKFTPMGNKHLTPSNINVCCLLWLAFNQTSLARQSHAFLWGICPEREFLIYFTNPLVVRCYALNHFLGIYKEKIVNINSKFFTWDVPCI